ncbi:hypothetical protein TNCV_4870201 [Trichonephila clavipes]|nr:hypothetical protein TNCV_4870201 [Trichonephila clavipes]
MSDVSDFQRCQIVGAPLARASATETSLLLGVFIDTVSNPDSIYTTRQDKLGKGVEFSRIIMHLSMQRNVQPWFDEHEDEVKRLPLPAQSPDFNIAEPLCDLF